MHETANVWLFTIGVVYTYRHPAANNYTTDRAVFNVSTNTVKVIKKTVLQLKRPNQ